VTTTAQAPTANPVASEQDEELDWQPASGPLRSGVWPRQVKVEITRANNRMRVALVDNSGPRSEAVARAIVQHLREADEVIHRRRWFDRCNPIDWWRGTSIEQAYRSLHAARVFLTELVDDEDVNALVPAVVARVQACLPATDPQRIEVEKLPQANPKIKRAELIRALERGYAATDEAHTRIRRFRNVLLCATALIAACTFLFVREVAHHPTTVPFCFQPDITTAQAATLPANQPFGNHRSVCPSGEQALGGTPQQPSDSDIWIVAGLGLLGGGLASAVSVRNMNHVATPYDVPLALTLLKVPTGALTAVAGILLLGGGFVPGLSELDTQRQILAYALVFGYAQQLATRYLDDRAATLLAELPSKHSPRPQTRSLPTSATDRQHPWGSSPTFTSHSPEAETRGTLTAGQPSTNGNTPTTTADQG
jgi:hypothetical protein